MGKEVTKVKHTSELEKGVTKVAHSSEMEKLVTKVTHTSELGKGPQLQNRRKEVKHTVLKN
jgi:hypothetical protein